MTTQEVTLENRAVTCTIPASEWKQTKGVRLHLLITKDGDEFSAIVLNLPGIGSCGSTEEEAVENAKDATRTALEVYEESQEEIPWKDTFSVEIPLGAKQKWIILDA